MQRYGRISAHKLTLAKHDEDILTQVRQNRPGVIFLEVAHPGGYAWNLINEIKINQDTCDIPVVICSWQDEELHGEHNSADFYLRLPILYEHFKSALEHIGG